MLELNVNGSVHRLDAPPDMPPLWALREPPGGVGELGVSAAIRNAFYAATGRRIRTLPVDPKQLAAS